MTRLIARFRDVNRGTINTGGHDIRSNNPSVAICATLKSSWNIVPVKKGGFLSFIRILHGIQLGNLRIVEFLL
jgi:hypothetical protein